MVMPEDENKSKNLGVNSLELHKKYQGKLQITSKCPIRNFHDFAYWYTPGVASPCLRIVKDRDLSFTLTNRRNSVAIVTDGTRVLGLGDIGPEASLPVMEGKSLLFKYLGGVDAFPICLDTKDPHQIITAIQWLTPSFGGINLEDIETPKCFFILEVVRKRLEIPAWHDDQQGTATIVLAGVINALKLVGKKLPQVQISLIGAGAANIKTVDLLIKAGVKPGNLFLVDSKGILTATREDLQTAMEKDQLFGKWKWELCLKTNQEERVGGPAQAMSGTDLCIAASTPGPGIIKKEWVKGMSDKAIVFACANPTPEIWPSEAKEAGARIVATGRSDFPNQINNSLVFPGVFRGVLDIQARTITDEMCIAAAHELARFAEDRGINEENIVPNMDEWHVYIKVAKACAMKAMEQGITKAKMTPHQLEERASALIKNSRDTISLLMKEKLIH